MKSRHAISRGGTKHANQAPCKDTSYYLTDEDLTVVPNFCVTHSFCLDTNAQAPTTIGSNACVSPSRIGRDVTHLRRRTSSLCCSSMSDVSGHAGNSSGTTALEVGNVAHRPAGELNMEELFPNLQSRVTRLRLGYSLLRCRPPPLPIFTSRLSRPGENRPSSARTSKYVIYLSQAKVIGDVDSPYSVRAPLGATNASTQQPPTSARPTPRPKYRKQESRGNKDAKQQASLPLSRNQQNMPRVAILPGSFF